MNTPLTNIEMYSLESVMRKSAIFILILLALTLTGCSLSWASWDPPEADSEAMENSVLQYMKDKYHISFEIIGSLDDHAEGWGYEDDYFTAEIKLPNSESDVSYAVTIEPNWVDENDDGFCDSYTITSENYFFEYCQSFVKPWIEEVVNDTVDYEDTVVFARAEYPGYAIDMTLPEDMEFYFSKQKDALITFYIGISSSEYEDNPDFKSSTKKLFDFMDDSGMKWQGGLYVYSDENFSKLKECSTYSEYISESHSMRGTLIFRLDEKLGLTTYE